MLNCRRGNGNCELPADISVDDFELSAMCGASMVSDYHGHMLSLVPRPSSLVGKNKGEEGLVKLIT